MFFHKINKGFLLGTPFYTESGTEILETYHHKGKAVEITLSNGASFVCGEDQILFDYDNKQIPAKYAYGVKLYCGKTVSGIKKRGVVKLFDITVSNKEHSFFVVAGKTHIKVHNLSIGRYLGGAVTTENKDKAIYNELKSGLERASEQAKGYMEEAKTLYEPYVQSGASSLNEYVKLLTGGVDALSEDKNFQALQNLAEKKVMANRAVSGLLRSGATASALDDTLLNFANTYYTNRLNQLGQGVSLGQYGASGSTSIYDKLGANATDLATALANIRMQQEANKLYAQTAKDQAAANKDAIENTGGLFGHGGFLGLGI